MLHINLFPFSTAPVFYFGEVEYHVDESDGYVEVKVWRTGTDLSKTASATVRSRKAEPVSAEGNIPLIEKCCLWLIGIFEICR